MLPFFRKIRWRLAANNQFFKYSRYAIGEIALVVIGILIALQINNWNEQQKSEAKIEILFEKMLIELAANINETQRVFEYSQHIDTLGYLVIRQLAFPEGSSHEVVFLSTRAYDNLLMNMEVLTIFDVNY